MLRSVVVVCLFVVAIGVGVFWFVTSPRGLTAAQIAAHTPDLANGKVMFDVGGCDSCHQSAKQKDRSLLGGGVELKSPFGTFYGPNISSDSVYGIGGWSDAEFLTAMQKGVGRKGEHLYPAFPYTSFRAMTQADLLDLHAYLKTLPAIQGRAPAHKLAFPFNVRRFVGVWKAVYLRDTPIPDDPEKSAQWNRGAYLVNGPGHCAECHSSRDAIGGIIPATRFAGGSDLAGKGWTPNITQHALGDWSVEDIAYMLETGSTPEGDSVGGSMSAVITNLAELPEVDRMAIAVYLKSLAPVADARKTKTLNR